MDLSQKKTHQTRNTKYTKDGEHHAIHVKTAQQLDPYPHESLPLDPQPMANDASWWFQPL